MDIIECNSYDGVTIGLIDGIMAILNVISTRDISSKQVTEALKDLQQDQNVIKILYDPSKKNAPNNRDSNKDG